MAIMETIKFVMFYSLEVVVVALAGIAVFAGLYQLVRDKVRQSRVSGSPATPKAA